jgi:hypothetical protein
MGMRDTATGGQVSLDARVGIKNFAFFFEKNRSRPRLEVGYWPHFAGPGRQGGRKFFSKSKNTWTKKKRGRETRSS